MHKKVLLKTGDNTTSAGLHINKKKKKMGC